MTTSFAKWRLANGSCGYALAFISPFPTDIFDTYGVVVIAEAKIWLWVTQTPKKYRHLRKHLRGGEIREVVLINDDLPCFEDYSEDELLHNKKTRRLHRI